MTKCPYVPPHPWNVDFPHTDAARQGDQVQARAGSSAGEKLLASTDVHGQFAGIPVVVQVVNAREPDQAGAQADGQARWACTPMPGCPSSRRSASAGARRRQGSARRGHNGERTPGKVAIFSTCYVNYNEPGIGHDLVKLLEHNDDPVRASSRRKAAAACPSSSSATSTRVAKHKEANIPVLAQLRARRLSRS